jgi:hypothetical protein
MKLPQGLPGPAGDDEADPLEAYRDRAMYLMATVGVAILLPLGVHSYLEGRIPLALAIGLVMVLLSVDAVALHRRKRPPLPYALLLFPMAAAIGIALKTTGIVGGFWPRPRCSSSTSCCGAARRTPAACRCSPPAR